MVIFVKACAWLGPLVALPKDLQAFAEMVFSSGLGEHPARGIRRKAKNVNE